MGRSKAKREKQSNRSSAGVRQLLFVPDSAAPGTAQIDAGQQMRLNGPAARKCSRRYLDTFDRALLRSACVLEHVEFGGTGRLRWFGAGGELHFECAIERLPRFASDVPAPAFRAALRRVTGVRALLVTGLERGTLSSAHLLDRRDKTVLRLEYWAPNVGRGHANRTTGLRSPYVHLLPLKGFDEALEPVRRSLERTCRPASLHRVLALESSDAPGPPRDAHEKLDARMRADTGFRQVLLELSRNVEDQHAAVLADLDTECLHDLRVALRRSRSLLARSDGVLPRAAMRRFSAGFAWLSSVTGPVRDLDVYTLELEGRAEEGETLAHALLPVVTQERSRQFLAMATALRSARYRRLVSAWTQFLEAPGPARTRLTDARRPLAEVAGERTNAVYRRLLRSGRCIEASTPIDEVHEVRKTAKKVRYLLEAFGSLWAPGAVDETARRLKRFQSYLGDLQDLCVQAELLLLFTGRGAAGPTGAALLPPAVRDSASEELKRLEARALRLKARFMRRFAAFDAKRRHRALKKVLIFAARGGD